MISCYAVPSLISNVDSDPTNQTGFTVYQRVRHRRVATLRRIQTNEAAR